MADLSAIANPIVPTPVNPLDTAERAVRFRNELMETRSRQAQGNALARATDANGKTDYAKARALMAQDPNAAYGLSEEFQRQNVGRGQDVQNQEANLAFQQHASTAAADGMGRVINNPSNGNIRGYAAFMKRLTPAAADQIDTIANQTMQLGTPAQRVEALKGAFTAHMGQESANRVFGTNASVEDGQHIYSGNQASSMDGGAFTPGSSIQRQLSPETNAQLTPVMVRDPKTGLLTPSIDTAGNVRSRLGGEQTGFTGRRVDVTGNGNPAPVMTGTPVGYEDQVKQGQDVRNSLMAQQDGVTQNEATLRNLDGLLSRLPASARSRKLADVMNNLDKFGMAPDPAYATLVQEIDKASATTRQQMLSGGAGPHTNAGLAELEHITPNTNMTPSAARALVNEQLTAAQYNRGRASLVRGVTDPTQVISKLADYDANFDPRYATISRLGREEGSEYARTHIGNRQQFEQSVYRMARAQHDKGYDYGIDPKIAAAIISQYEAAQHGGR